MKMKAELPTKSNSLLLPLAAGFAIGVLAVGTAVLIWQHDSPSHPDSIPTYRTSEPSAPSPAAPMTAGSMAGMPGMPGMNLSTAPALDPAVARVAARFACSCGTCGEKRLDVCSCETAQQERAFIQEQLRKGHSEEEAAQALKQKYRGLNS